MQNQKLEKAMDVAASKGRGGDTVVGHLTRGEVVVPRQLIDRSPELRDMLKATFKANGGSMDEFTVGHEMNKINPQTKQPEFAWWDTLLQKAKDYAPVIGAAGTLYAAYQTSRQASAARADAAEQARLAREQASAEAQKARDAALKEAELARQQQQAQIDAQREQAASSLEAARLSAEQQKQLLENLAAQQRAAAEAAKAQLYQQQQQYQEQKTAMEKAAAEQAKAIQEERRKIAKREAAQMTARRRSGRRSLLSKARLTAETGLPSLDEGEIRMTTSLGG